MWYKQLFRLFRRKKVKAGTQSEPVSANLEAETKDLKETISILEETIALKEKTKQILVQKQENAQEPRTSLTGAGDDNRRDETGRLQPNKNPGDEDSFVEDEIQNEEEAAEVSEYQHHSSNKFMSNYANKGAYSQEWVPIEFQYLENLIAYRLGKHREPAFPDIESWDLPLKNYIKRLGLKHDQDVCTLLLIALAPHAFPDLFDKAIENKIATSGDFPEIGGVRGKNFRGFIPTGQTAAFLLAGNDWEKRSAIEQLFWSNHDLARRKILWLEELPPGEPVMSGRIVMALDYIDLFLFDTSAPPHFSTSFPAKRITTSLGIDNIVMNKEVKRHFKNLEEWIHHNDSLLNEWGMQNRVRQGFRVLFYGPAGTGKTLTATVLGNQVNKEVYKIDLSMVVSKYIGETEKNLELLFARAEDKDWILFFDEADAIFGKRTSVRDAHDKYANQEVSYLLQRIEDFNGLVILATNMKNNIDDAFLRRFDDIVRFVVPDEEERKEIWEKSFPEEAEYGDIPEKVKKYNITGGHIINAVHFAGIQAVKKRNDFMSIEGGLPPSQNELAASGHSKLRFYLSDVLEGIKREMIKEGRPFV